MNTNKTTYNYYMDICFHIKNNIIILYKFKLDINLYNNIIEHNK